MRWKTGIGRKKLGFFDDDLEIVWAKFLSDFSTMVVVIDGQEARATRIVLAISGTDLQNPTICNNLGLWHSSATVPAREANVALAMGRWYGCSKLRRQQRTESYRTMTGPVDKLTEFPDPNT